MSDGQRDTVILDMHGGASVTAVAKVINALTKVFPDATASNAPGVAMRITVQMPPPSAIVRRAQCVHAANESYDDLALLGLAVSAAEAATRCGITPLAARLGLVRLHYEAGRSAKQTAAVVGVTPRTVVRYRRRLRTNEWAEAS